MLKHRRGDKEDKLFHSMYKGDAFVLLTCFEAQMQVSRDSAVETLTERHMKQERLTSTPKEKKSVRVQNTDGNLVEILQVLFCCITQLKSAAWKAFKDILILIGSLRVKLCEAGVDPNICFLESLQYRR